MAAIDRSKDDRIAIGKNKYGWTELHSAAANGDLSLVRELLRRGDFDVNAPDDFELNQMPMTVFDIHGSDFFSRSMSLFDSMATIDPEALQARKKDFKLLSVESDTKGATALHYAMFSGNKEIVKLLVENGANPNIKDNNNRLPEDYTFDGWLKQYLKEICKNFEEEKLRREKEYRKQFPLEQRLKESIVGQEGPINSVASAIRRRENGWHDESRPLVFLFLGSSGIGKTELGKQVAKYLTNDVNKGFIRIDMSEFQTKHEVAKFIGSPPGYIGYEEGGQLTEKLKKYQDGQVVVLLDEVEKAHPDILTVMLQLFDEGRLTDGKGNTVECKNAIFILTSNLAQTEIADEAELLRSQSRPTDTIDNPLSKQFQTQVVYPILRKHFRRDEFLGRIDEILYFLPFNESELQRIVQKELEIWKNRAKERHDIDIQWSSDILYKLSEGYNIRYGARSIKHEVDKKVINQLARAAEYDELSPGDSVFLYLNDEQQVQFKITAKGTNNKKWSWFGSQQQ